MDKNTSVLRKRIPSLSVFFSSSFFICLLIAACGSDCHSQNSLRVSTDNPRYFTDRSGKAIYLTGSHTWNTLVEMNTPANPQLFDFDAYLDFLKRYNHNFIRLWTWELFIYNDRPEMDEHHKLHRTSPLPWLTVNGEPAPDGNQKFDLTKFNPAYFERLRQRVAASKEKGIYVSIMLFEGWGEQFRSNSFQNHPFYPLNNVNNIMIDTTGDVRALSKHELVNKQVLAIQEAYVKKVIETVNDLDNVLYEISNENHPASTEWQYHMINFIKKYEKSLPNQHPVGMTFQYEGGKNKTLFDSPADWISPNAEGGYKVSPKPSDGSKVVLTDTDHLWGLGGNHQWVWKSFMQGLNPIFMDPYDGKLFQHGETPRIPKEEMELIRKNMGYTLKYAQRMSLIDMLPDTTLSSSGYCLRHANREYLVYIPEGNKVELNFASIRGAFSTEWFDPLTGNKNIGDKINGGKKLTLISPFKSGEAVLYLKRL